MRELGMWEGLWEKAGTIKSVAEENIQLEEEEEEKGGEVEGHE